MATKMKPQNDQSAIKSGLSSATYGAATVESLEKMLHIPIEVETIPTGKKYILPW
jgi:hypothetical protein